MIFKTWFADGSSRQAYKRLSPRWIDIQPSIEAIGWIIIPTIHMIFRDSFISSTKGELGLSCHDCDILRSPEQGVVIPLQ